MAQSKLVVYNSLSAFLVHALAPVASEALSPDADPTKPMRAWFLKNAFTSEDAFIEFEQLLLPKQPPFGRGTTCQLWREHVEYEENDDEFISTVPMAKPSSGAHWTLQDLTESSIDGERVCSASDPERSLAAVRISSPGSQGESDLFSAHSTDTTLQPDCDIPGLCTFCLHTGWESLSDRRGPRPCCSSNRAHLV